MENNFLNLAHESYWKFNVKFLTSLCGLGGMPWFITDLPLNFQGSRLQELVRKDRCCLVSTVPYVWSASLGDCSHFPPFRFSDSFWKSSIKGYLNICQRVRYFGNTQSWWAIFTKRLHLGLRELCGRGSKKVIWTNGMKDTNETVSSRHNGTDAYMNSQRPWQQVQASRHGAVLKARSQHNLHP